jgi:hypothetical protein
MNRAGTGIGTVVVTLKREMKGEAREILIQVFV